jgi:endo-1,4-beta-mannosidase
MILEVICMTGNPRVTTLAFQVCVELDYTSDRKEHIVTVCSLYCQSKVSILIEDECRRKSAKTFLDGLFDYYVRGTA